MFPFVSAPLGPNQDGNRLTNGKDISGLLKLVEIWPQTKIKSLSLGWNRIGAKGASALAVILKGTQITNLNIRGNEIGDEGAFALAAVLKETQITTLKCVAASE